MAPEPKGPTVTDFKLTRNDEFAVTIEGVCGGSEGGETVSDPELIVRVYHDAKLVEAMGCIDEHHHAALRSFDTCAIRELGRRWARNIMLNKWLEYCYERGHSFTL